MHKKLLKCAVYTLGCKLNFAESNTIENTFKNIGYKIVDISEKSDLYIINTCSVTSNADKECHYIIRKIKRKCPNSYVVVTGCYAQLKPDYISKIPGVNIVISNSNKFNLGNIIGYNISNIDKSIIYNDFNNENIFQPANSLFSKDRTRVFLKIQDGCNYKCSFCTIPISRGKSRSNTINNILEEAKFIINNGAKEIVLTGVNIGDYKNKNNNLLHLLEKLDNIENINRIRISSIEPNLLSNDMINFIKDSKHIVRHLHIPIQSGNNNILKLMRRRYMVEFYKNKIETIKSLMPDCCIGADLIVGFPTEDNYMFDDTYKFIKNIDISYLHVFTYSDRDNTFSNKMQYKICTEIKKQRNKIMRNLSNKKLHYFYHQNIGKTEYVLFEKKNKNGFIYGYTRNFIKVKTLFNSKLVNSIQKVILCNIDNDYIVNVNLI